MAAHDGSTEAPLVVGGAPTGAVTGPGADDHAGAGSASRSGALQWGIVALGVALVAVALAGIGLRPPASDDLVTQVAPASPTATVVEVPVDTVVTAPGRRQTVTVWQLPSGVSTWWSLGDHVVFVTRVASDVTPRVFVHDKTSGRAGWSVDVTPGQVVVVRDVDTDDRVRFTVPGGPATSAGGQADVDGLELSVRDGSVLTVE